MVKRVNGFDELNTLTDGLRGPALIGFFSSTSEKSRSAEPEFYKFCEKHSDLNVYLVDVAKVKDIHSHFGVDMVPTVLEIKNGAVAQKIVGVGTASQYEEALLIPFQAAKDQKSGGEQKKTHRVVIYTSPTCSWCSRTKSYLKQHNIQFTEIDVSKDYAAAQRLVSRTGARGVPQLDIDGHFVVGFDRPKIDALLGIGNKGNMEETYS